MRADGAMLKPGARLAIGGQSCIVVSDVVSDRLPPPEQRVVVLGREKDRFFYAASETVRQARARAPDATVAGVWQLLSASGALPAHRYLSIIYFDEQKNGQYLLQDDVVLSGEVKDGKPVTMFGYLIDMERASEIDVEELTLKLPPVEIDEPDSDKSVGNGKGAVAGCAILAIAITISATMEWRAHTERQDIIAQSIALREQATRLQTRYNELQASRIGKWPGQRNVLKSFLALALRRIDFSVYDADLMQPEFHVISDPERYRRTRLIRLLPRAGIRPRHDGKLDLHWNNERVKS